MSDKPSVKFIGKTNLEFLRACLGSGGAWLFWQMAVPGFELFAAFAAVFAIGGMLCLGRAIYQVFRQILNGRIWARYRRKGATPKADELASEDDLRARGILK